MSLKNASLDQVRININNGQTYTMTAAVAFATLGNAVLQGFASSVGDGGRATFTSNLTSATNFTLGSTASATLIDLIFANTGASNANHLFLSSSTADVVFIRCVFKGARGVGFLESSASVGNAYLFECEAYDCDKSNTANNAGIHSANVTGGMVFCYRCYSHDHTGSNANGFQTSLPSGLVMVDCISESNGGAGVATSATAPGLVCINCNFYNNTGDGVKLGSTNATTWAVFINNNFLKNTGAAINNTVSAQGGITYNSGRGAGSQANAADVLKSILVTSTDITYASGDTPWNAPATGDFTTIPTSAARSAGRGVFTETDGTNTGTVAYPDIGAAQALVTPELRIPSIASI